VNLQLGVMSATASNPATAVSSQTTMVCTRQAGKRAIRDFAVAMAGLVYLSMVLFLNLNSPFFGVLVIVLAGYEILEPRSGRRAK
jgi:hypothetical protein